MTFQEYMLGTRYAVIQLFDSLVHYQALIYECMSPNFSMTIDIDSTNDDMNEAYLNFCNDNSEFKEKQEYSNKKFDEYITTYQIAHASICGSILQMAHMGISKFSQSKEACQCLTGNHTRFCVGRIVRGLPIGLIIYAGRNQYNHWDDKAPHKHAKCIFDKLASPYEDLDDKHPSFDIENSCIDIYSANILGLLEWRKYEDYERDMIDMLNNQEVQNATTNKH